MRENISVGTTICDEGTKQRLCFVNVIYCNSDEFFRASIRSIRYLRQCAGWILIMNRLLFSQHSEISSKLDSELN